MPAVFKSPCSFNDSNVTRITSPSIHPIRSKTFLKDDKGGNRRMRRREKIGSINEIVIDTLNLPIQPNTPIFSGETNLINMREDHPEDFEKYGDHLTEIISSPDYISLHPRQGSIEYIKLFYDEKEEERVLVAIRNSKSGVFFARSLYVMGKDTVLKYKKNGSFKEYRKDEMSKKEARSSKVP